jgi:hypothetical protein
MAEKLQLRRGTSSQVASGIPAQGEVWHDTTYNSLTVGDNITNGGWPAAKLDEVSRLVLRLREVDLGNLGDTLATIALPPNITRYKVDSVTVVNASSVPSNAHIGVYTGANQTGAVIAAQQALTAITTIAANTARNVTTLAITANVCYISSILYINVGTANDTSLTADVIIAISPL